MTHFSLTKEQSQILDDIIQFMFNQNHDRQATLKFHEHDYLTYRKKNKLRDISHEELLGIISISKIYMKGNDFNPLNGELDEMWLTKNAAGFRTFGGFQKVYEIENKKNGYENQLRKSTIWTMWLAIAVGVLSAAAAIQTCRYTNQQLSLQSEKANTDSTTCKSKTSLSASSDTPAVKEKTTTLTNGVNISSKVDTPALKQNLVDNKKAKK